MSINSNKLKGLMISSHPYAFDAMFVSTSTQEKRWAGVGNVVLHAIGGGVNQVWALVEADDEGYARLKEAGFNVQIANQGRYVDSSGESHVVLKDGGMVRKASQVRKKAVGR